MKLTRRDAIGLMAAAPAAAALEGQGASGTNAIELGWLGGAAPAHATGVSWGVPTAWSIEGYFEHHFTPKFYIDPEASVAALKWSHTGGLISPSMTSLIVGADIGWAPVTNLSFDLELMFQTTDQAKPAAYFGTNVWVANSSGFAGRLRIQRNF